MCIAGRSTLIDSRNLLDYFMLHWTNHNQPDLRYEDNNRQIHKTNYSGCKYQITRATQNNKIASQFLWLLVEHCYECIAASNAIKSIPRKTSHCLSEWRSLNAFWATFN